jgi:LruC domain-containing protein
MKKLITIPPIFIALIFLLITACKKDVNQTLPVEEEIKSISQLIADPDFDWKTETSIEFKITVPEDAPQGVIKIYSAKSNLTFFRGMPDDQNNFTMLLNIPTYLQEVDISYSNDALLPATIPVTLKTTLIEHTFQFKSLKSTLEIMADDDGDGVENEDDDYPDDPTRAFDNSYPATYNTLAFEDTYKGVGDYDFNDLVADYRFEYVTNAQNEIVDTLKFIFVVRASGAAHKNGFGFQLPGVSQSLITKVSGYRLTADYISLDAKGLENGHDEFSPTIIVFDDSYSLFPENSPYGPKKNTIVFESLLNCDTASSIEPPYYGYDVFEIFVEFVDDVLAADLNLPNWNPFLIESYPGFARCLEIHLPDYPTTALGTCSTVENYKTPINNLPWAINVGSDFDYTLESGCPFDPIGENTVVDPDEFILEMNRGHLKFIEWVQSNGASFPDWYMPKPGYRECDFFYINLHQAFTPNVCAHYLDPSIYPYLPNNPPE